MLSKNVARLAISMDKKVLDLVSFFAKEKGISISTALSVLSIYGLLYDKEIIDKIITDSK